MKSITTLKTMFYIHRECVKWKRLSSSNCQSKFTYSDRINGKIFKIKKAQKYKLKFHRIPLQTYYMQF